MLWSSITRCLCAVLALAALALTSSTVFAAHLVTFVNGGTLEVESYRMEGSRIVLTLPGGGEIAFPPRQVLGIAAKPPAPPAPASPSSSVPSASQIPSPSPPAIGELEVPRVSPWDPEPGVRALIRHVAGTLGVDARLVEAMVETESRFDPYAVSRRGAMGLMQLMPQTARRFQVGNVFDPRQNLEGGTRYLKELLARYGDTALALAAYNAGEDAVDRYGGIPPFQETRGYVSRILRRLKS